MSIDAADWSLGVDVSGLLRRIEQSRLFKAYGRLFSVDEIAAERSLQWAAGAFLLAALYSFGGWMTSAAISVSAYQANAYSCWPYFQDCGRFFFLEVLPYGYSQSLLYMGLFALIALAAYLLWKRSWPLAHACLLLLWLWKFLVVFVLTNTLSGNYEYYDIVLGAVLLLAPYKLYFLRLVFVLLYFLAATIKFNAGWIAGTYFTSLKEGLPLVPNALVPLFTNFVILEQTVGAWFLLSRRPLVQRGAFVLFLIFHLYSGILVSYRYPISTVPMLVALFGPHYRSQEIPHGRRSTLMWLLIALLFAAQLYATFDSPDRRLTLEGNMYGLYMFEANHQCVSTIDIIYKDGATNEGSVSSDRAQDRCDPYTYWFNLKQQCLRDPSIQSIHWTFDHSVNGGPFYRIVNTTDACTLLYAPFGHNAWITTPSSGAPIIGYPEKNYF